MSVPGATTIPRRALAAAIALALAVAAVLAGLAGEPASTAQAANGKKLRSVIAISNNWDGTIDFADARTFEVLERINAIPDRDERMSEILLDPVALGFFLGVRELIGEGHDQFVDDAFLHPNGRFIYVSRPSFADVVAIELATERIVWRFEVDGVRADHMAISEDGSEVIVSASTGNVGHVIDTTTGEEINRFESGDSPHETNYSEDGELLYHAAIGRVYTPTDEAQLDTTKGETLFQIVDADTMEIVERFHMKGKLAEAGHPNMSDAVRPMALSPSERFLYAQVSFLHGFVEYDFKTDRVTRVIRLPVADHVKGMPKENYLLDSAHHGIALDPTGRRLCVAGTMSDYAAIVSRRKPSRFRILPVGPKPYWSTNSADGKHCYVSVSGSDRVAVISYRKRKEVASIPVGDHPQRVRTGVVVNRFLRD
jgi:YVTN family beta-propeller protein